MRNIESIDTDTNIVDAKKALNENIITLINVECPMACDLYSIPFSSCLLLNSPST